MTRTRRPAGTWKRRIGAVMMASSLLTGAAVATLTPAVAEEAETQDAAITKRGFYAAPLSDVIPQTVLKGFPPQVVCLVIVKSCTGQFHESQPEGLKEGYGDLRGGVSDGMSEVQGRDPGEPASPIPPDHHPVSITAGNARYRSAVLFELPSVAEGDQVDSFQLILKEAQPTGGISSPALRQAVLAFMTCARGCQGDQFEKILTSEPVERAPLGIEACPIVDDPTTERNETDWQAERSQSEGELPAADCVLGGSGQRQEDGTWVFDLTFAMEAWNDGELPNAGVLIRPQSAPNFAYGDPDSSFNKQVTFAPELQYRIATSEEPAPIDNPFGSPSGGGEGFSGDGGTSGASTGGSSGGFTTTGGSTGGNVSTFSAPADSAGGDSAPVVAESGGGDGAPAASGFDSEPVAAGNEEGPGSAWYVWLLVPVFLGGMWMTAQTLTAEPQAVAAGRSGAMTRLLERQQAGALAPPELA